jgi:hypothetical protein
MFETMGARPQSWEQWEEVISEIRIRVDTRASIDPTQLTSDELLESIRQSRDDLRLIDSYQREMLGALADRCVWAWLESGPVLPTWFVNSDKAATRTSRDPR